jgi:hypothetical protein
MRQYGQRRARAAGEGSGYHVADVRTVAELSALGIDLADLCEAGSLASPRITTASAAIAAAAWHPGDLASQLARRRRDVITAEHVPPLPGCQWHHDGCGKHQ